MDTIANLKISNSNSNNNDTNNNGNVNSQSSNSIVTLSNKSSSSSSSVSTTSDGCDSDNDTKCTLAHEDSESSSSSNFYEGTEKLLEVWFTRTDGRTDNCDLRLIQRSAWESMLKFVRCEILSYQRSKHFDGYVLSESSMFVYKERIILKTCGTTTLLNCIEPLLYLARKVANFNEVLDVFYSRKNFMRPHLQDKLHANFESEISVLDSEFEVGSAYCLGKMNRNCWYLYTLHPEKGVTMPDQTLELIMVDLDEQVMGIFNQVNSQSAREATQKSGIDRLFPGGIQIIDDYLFNPCGYSMNGFLRSGHYVTIHVTPEQEFSYVSFETNAPPSSGSYFELISKVLKLFQPNKFMITLFTNETSTTSSHLHEYKGCPFAGYQCEENQLTRFKNYELTFGNYCREAG